MKPDFYTRIRHFFSFLLLGVLALPFSSNGQANNACGGAIVLTPGASCTTTSGTITNGTTTYTAIPNGTGCSGSTSIDLWYRFVATTTNPVITLGGASTRRRLQLFTGTCPAGLTSTSFCGTGSISPTGLTVGDTYYIRVYSSDNSTLSFTICIVDGARPANDNCAGAIAATAATCGTTRSLLNAGSTGSVPNDCGPAGSPDAWFSYVATSQFPNFTLSNLGSDFTLSRPRLQLFSGTCGTLTSLACVSGLTLNTLTAIGGNTGLTIGATYLIRVFTDTTKMFGANWNYRLCPSDPTTSAPTVDYGKSYINITKQSNGGTIEPGDELEIRATFVVRSNNAYDCSFTDNLSSNTSYVPNSLRILTSEGKIFRQWTDATDSDPANITGTAVSFKIGNGANSTTGGPVRNLDRPSLFGGTCVLIASYRVIVNPAAPYGTVISVGGGQFRYRTQPTNPYTNINFPAVNAMLYRDYGICSNAVSNAISSESGGTFGSGTTKDRIASNKVPLNYTYALFGPNAPQDYYYGMSNNTSTGTGAANYSVNPNETASARRVFGVWDVLGDHTGAVDPIAGNLPANVNAGQSGGYMAVINAAYRTDTAFLDTITNLCPNTSYEYSAWFRNVCPKCGCDSTGTGASGAGYLPTAPGDSSGIRPTLTFNINGYDYYSTGDILYTKQWVKKGFTYRTGPSETQMVINIRNNAPGGGGNDWAIDDIAVSTCLPNMSYSPSLSPNVCTGNAITIYDTIRSYFDNYTHHQWQRSTDGGTTWTDIGLVRDSVPQFDIPSNSWQYVTAYTIPAANTTLADSGNLYRVIVATTNSNLTNSSCQVTDGVSIITLAVLDCGPVLSTNLLSFSATLSGRDANLSWATSREEERLSFAIERSYDGQNFVQVGIVSNYLNGDAINRYNFIDAGAVTERAWYRVVMINADGKRKNSAVIPLKKYAADFDFGNVINPFSNQLRFDIIINQNASLTIELVDMNGRIVRKEKQPAFAGINSLRLSDTEALQTGAYTLRVTYKDRIIYKRVVKTN